MNKANDKQNRLREHIKKFKSKTRSQDLNLQRTK